MGKTAAWLVNHGHPYSEVSRYAWVTMTFLMEQILEEKRAEAGASSYRVEGGASRPGREYSSVSSGGFDAGAGEYVRRGNLTVERMSKREVAAMFGRRE